MISQDIVIEKILQNLDDISDRYWIDRFMNTDLNHIHIAVMVEPYLTLILEGKKTIESRFSKKRISPFHRVEQGDIVILKRSGGGYVGVFEAGEVLFFEPKNSFDIQKIKEKYNDLLCISDDFWELKKDSHYATLIEIKKLCKFIEFQINEANRKSWVDFVDEIESPRQISLQEYLTQKPVVICLAGKAGSGKTTISRNLASQLDCDYVTVSDYLRTLCVHNSPNREELQNKGNECISKGWASFVHDFMQYAKWDNDVSLIIDGIRHIPFMEMLRLFVYPVRPICVYLDAEEDVIQKRLNERGFEIIDQLSVSEGYNEKMEKCADLVIQVKNQSVEQICCKIIDFAKQHIEKTLDENTNPSLLRKYIDWFNLIRNWKSYHNPRDLAMSISIEAAELLEIFQWGKGSKTESRQHIEDELADVLIYSIDFANCMGFDLTQIIMNKLKKNAIKYPEKNIH